MKIAFVNPPFKKLYSRTQRSPAVTKGGTLYYPYWLSYACGWTIKNGQEGELFDFIARENTHKEAIEILRDGQYKMIVIDTATPSIINDTDFAVKLKKVLPGTIIIMVGTHVSAVPEETLKKTRIIDACAIGEYDETILEAAIAIEEKKNLECIPGLVLMREGKIFRTPPRPPITSDTLDKFPFVTEVYKKFLNIRDYYFAAAHYPMVMIISARGCPFGCNFCIYWQTLHGKAHRARSPANVVAEFEYIKKVLPEVKEIVIEDDTFTANILRVREICKLLIQKKNKLKWCANVRVGIDLETLKLMKKAGCRLVITGFESGNQQILNNMGKHARVSQAYQHAENAKQSGILIHGCFMVGNPGETKATMKETLELAKKLNCDSAQFYPLFVYPGTVSFKWFTDHNSLSTNDYSKWLKSNGEHNTLINLPGITSGELVDFCEKAYLQYYLRPNYLLIKIRQLFTNRDEGLRSLHSAANFLRTKFFASYEKKHHSRSNLL